ncbi:MAG: DNA cytosine methyltransferase [Clostridia bacterium]|nr:DNA cytosine methyltransferase [Clostridia bacterium]
MQDFEQLSLFDDIYTEYKITKPVRLISFFSGIEAQFKALSFLGKTLQIPTFSYKTCEWAYNSIIGCNAIHNRDFTDYSNGLSKSELVDKLNGISVNYNEPLTIEQLSKKPLKWLQNAYNNSVANHNLLNIMNVHAKDLNITETDKYEYILTYSFPCQDISLAGQRAGFSVSQSEEGGTRSGLLWEVERILTECKQINSLPQILVMENVPQIHSEKDYPNFEKWILRLEQLGYCNFWADLNAKDYGIPQNRERTFMVSILGKDIQYKFPRPIPRKYNLKDFLEESVPEKYYLSEKMINYLTGVNQKQSKYDRASRFESSLKLTNESGVAGCITTAAGQRVTDNFVIVKENTEDGYRIAHEGDGINISSRMHHQRGNVQYGLSQTIKTNCEVGVCEFNDSEFTETEAKLFTDDGNVYRYIGSDIIDKFEEGDMATTTFPNGYGHGPRTHKDLSITLNTIDKPVVKKNFRIRKLTPKEAMRLMAFQDIDVQHMYESGLTDGAVFHCAGDSLLPTIMIGIFGKLFGLTQERIKQLIYDYINEIFENKKNDETR